MNVYTLPLCTGQELVVDLTHIDDVFINVKTPMVFQVIQDPQTGKPTQAFGEWPALALSDPEQVVRIPISSVLAMPLKAHEQIERNYVSNLTGLELPPAQPKILLS